MLYNLPLDISRDDADDPFEYRYIGYADFAGSYFPGKIGEVRIYSSILSEQEAKDYHNQFARQVKQRGRFALDFGVGDTIG